MSKILVVDDDRLIRELISDCLMAEGHEVRLAESGEAALAIINAGFEFDVLITDMMMPVQSGVELIDGLRRRGFRQKMIVVTGQVRHEAVPGADDVIAKPFHLERLINAVKRSN